MARLIGTAGHVDHGKTSLIRALTGIDADRLPEEKRRGMTIDIGFAHLQLPGVGDVSIVDVPGHERFLGNMLVGALGTDVALLCVAADEGVMPQTREHLEILELLPVERLVVALTRADLADEDTRALAATEVRELLAGTRFGSDAPVVAVSSATGEGLDELRRALAEALQAPERPSRGPWYLPVDRAFTVRGHGCVVTGTLAQGTVRVGDAAVLEPGGRTVRVRGMQIHGQPAASSEKGRRTALNLSGVGADEVRRGQAVGAPGALFATLCLDARVRWRASAERVRHGMRVRAAIGSADALGRLFLNAHEPDLIQLRLDEPVACALGQPLIVRRHSPSELLCGGRVTVPQAKPRRRSERPVGSGLDALELDQALLRLAGEAEAGLPSAEASRLLGRSVRDVREATERLLADGRLIALADLLFTPETFRRSSERFQERLREMHAQRPSAPAHPRERVAQAAGLPWTGRQLDRVLARMAEEGRLVVEGTLVRDPSFQVPLTPRQRQFLDRVKAALDEAGVNAPSIGDLARALGVPPQAVEEILRIGVDRREVLRLAVGLHYTPETLAAIQEAVRRGFGERPFTAGQFRDLLGTSRKYAIPLLEHLDATRFTVRRGDQRVVAR
ncbi:MAG: selenocysteine-specific translation elongation factor [Fimbriimonadales bacterium]|nr:selenocysteine-specific translation elongation factor [Fimbriimonadales bacterium]